MLRDFVWKRNDNENDIVSFLSCLLFLALFFSSQLILSIFFILYLFFNIIIPFLLTPPDRSDLSVARINQDVADV